MFYKSKVLSIFTFFQQKWEVDWSSSASDPVTDHSAFIYLATLFINLWII